MLSDLIRNRAFYLGTMFDDAARRHGGTAVELDTPMEILGEDTTSFTVASLADRVDEVAGMLWQCGVRPSENVAVHKRPGFDIAVSVCAAARIGAVPVPISPALDGENTATLLSRLSRPWLITDGPTLDGPLAGRHVSALTSGVLTTSSDPRPGATPLPGLRGAPRVEPVRLHRREPALITHSSGTTGVPKLMVHCAESIWHRVMPQRLLAWPVRGREPVALCMSFVHSRFYHSLAVFLHHGNPLAIMVDTDPDVAGPMLARVRPGVVETHPNNFVQWESLADAPDRPLSSVRYFSSTFDAIHPRTIRRLTDASDRRRPKVVQLYGQSETGPITGTFHTSRMGRDARCVGWPVPGFVRLRVVGDDGRPVRTGRSGSLEVRGPGRIATYLGEHDRYEANLHDGWWRLGDDGYRDRLGRLHMIDRAVDRTDELDSGLEVEDIVLERLDELAEITIVHADDGRAVPVVATRQDRPLEPRRWQEAVADLPTMQAPQQWRFDGLPRTSTWKVRRLEIARMMESGEHRRHLVTAGST